MRNERGPKKTGRSRSASGGSSSYKKTSSTRSKSSGFGKDDKKPGGFKKTGGPKKFGTGTKKEGDSGRDNRTEKRFSKDKPTFKSGFKKTGGNSDTGFKKDGEERSFKPITDFKRSPRTNNKPASTDRWKKDGEEKSFKPKTDLKKSPRTYNKPNNDKWKKEGEEKDGEKKFAPKKSGSYAEYKKRGSDKVKSGSSFEERKEFKKKTGLKTYTDKKDGDKTYYKSTEIVRKKDGSKGFKKSKVYTNLSNEKVDADGSIRLNKFIANAGICSRREADTYIQTGVVTVNGVTITELGYKVKPEDRVLFHDKPIIGEKHVYILLNKPKDYITTSKDPQNRKTVLDLINGVKERVFPVGRLDRNTSGVLLLTNDGALAEKLMHPRKGITKIYHVELDKKFASPDMAELKKGIELEDGFFTPDEVDYVEGMDKHHVGIQIHSGANRIVRRLFEALEYDVIKLDRVVYAGLTKKGLTRGKWRFLKDSEVFALKMM